jgi:exopolyphosphatase/guanosine-5'-triphosphate,3'-diphosphate pyrophosphatase
MSTTEQKGNFISLEEASEMTAQYRENIQPGGTIAVAVSSDIINGILTQANCTGLRFYFAIDASGSKTLVAVAGTATTVAAAALELGEYDRHSIHLSRISAEKTHLASQRFLSMTREERLALGYMHPGRVDVIAAGSLVLSEIMKATGAKEFIACESDILDGMAWSI